jgi:hypothetical protein
MNTPNTAPVCSFCQKAILKDHASVPDEYGEDGDRLHLYCSIQLSDGADIDSDHGDS